MTRATWVTVAIDIGQTGARARIVDADSAATIDLAGHVTGQTLVATIRRILGEVALAWGPDLSLSCLSLGLTGLHGVTPRSLDVRAEIPTTWDVQRVIAVDDGVAAYLAGVGAQPGVVVAVGTGVVAVAWDGVSRWSHGDGIGPLLGDRGGGYWIGLHGLREAVRLARSGRDSILVESARRRYGNLLTLHQRLEFAPTSVAAVAAFCADVIAAARALDPQATAIVCKAVSAIADTTVACARDAGLSGRAVTYAMVGRVAAATDLVVEPWRTSVMDREPTYRWSAAQGTPLDALSALARGDLPRGVESVAAVW